MRIGITLNEVVRTHYNTVEDAYEMYVREINQTISKGVYDELSEEDKEEISKRKKEIINIGSETDDSVMNPEEKSEIELTPLKVYDLSNNDLNEVNLQSTEISLSVERDIISIEESNDPMGLCKIHKFSDVEDFENFLYHEQSFEIFSRTPLTYPQVMLDLDLLYNFLSKKNNSITIVSQERENSKSATLLFLAQNQFKGNNIKFLYDYSKIWELYDLIITADPYIIKTKPDNKVCLKVITEHNKDIEGNKIFSFESIKEIYNHFKANLK
jgi:hypothetical protein